MLKKENEKLRKLIGIVNEKEDSDHSSSEDEKTKASEVNLQKITSRKFQEHKEMRAYKKLQIIKSQRITKSMINIVSKDKMLKALNPA